MSSGPVQRAGGNSPLRALVVDDEPPLVQVVRGYLERAGFEVSAAADGATAVELARQVKPDVIVLDLMLPGIDGIETCRQIRTFSDAYVVMLTAKSDEIDKLIGLSIGADDYLTKPFSPRELIARIQAMLRRPRAAESTDESARSFGALTIDVSGREVRLAGQPVSLTRTEFDLLDALSQSPGQALSRAQLLARISRDNYFGDEHVVDVHIGNLRRKLADDPARPRYVRTIRGVGFRMGHG